MSLYGDLYSDDGGQKPTWDANLKLLQSHIQLKKVALTQQREKGRPASSASISVLEQNKTKPIVVAESLFASPQEKHSFFEDLHVKDEYNPLYPNDYEKIAKRRDEERQKRKEEERKKAAEERERRRKERYESGSRRSDDEDEDEEGRRSSWRQDREKRSVGAAIAPPPSLASATDSADARAEEAETSGGGAKRFVKPFVATSKGMNVAAKIMEKYGYRHGGGLGKQEQGMSTALQVEKLGLRGGKIIHERDSAKDMMMPPPAFAQHSDMSPSAPPNAANQGDDSGPSITELLKNPTKVVLLRNMVGPGEVDDDLDGEIKEEMSKYGEVVNVVIFEMPGAGPEEAVRIFVEYPKIDQAIKALVGLNGRFFGGRSIRAMFYNQEKYKKFELGE